MGSRTPYLNFYQPTFQETGWDDELNDNFDTLDQIALASGATTPRTPSDRFAEVVNVADYGAFPTNSASANNIAFQAAFDAAVARQACTVVFPGSRIDGHIYHFDGDLMLAPASGQVHINLLGLGGCGANGITLSYGGAGTAMTIKNNTAYSLDGLRILNEGTGAIGLKLTSTAVGSNHGASWYPQLSIKGFTTNLMIGEATGEAASELLFGMLDLSNSTLGCLIQGRTSGAMFCTNIRMLFLAGTNNTTLLKVTASKNDAGSGVSIMSGSMSNNGLEFDFETPGNYYLGHFRTEGATGQLVKSGSNTATQNSAFATKLTIENVQTSYASTPSNKVALFNAPGQYTVRGGTVLQTGSIELGGFDGGAGPRKSTLKVEESIIVSADPTIALRASSNTVWEVLYQQNGNSDVETVNTEPGRHYLIKTDGTEIDLEPRFPWDISAGTLNTIGTYVNADLTPTVAATRVLVIANSAPATITQLDDGVEGQEVTLKFSDSNTTIQDGTNFQLAGGANFVSSADDTLTLVKCGAYWYEKCRSVN